MEEDRAITLSSLSEEEESRMIKTTSDRGRRIIRDTQSPIEIGTTTKLRKNNKTESNDSECSAEQQQTLKSILTSRNRKEKTVRFTKNDEIIAEAAYGKYNIKGTTPSYGYMPQTWTRPTYTILNNKEYLEDKKYDWVRNTLLNRRRLLPADRLSNKRPKGTNVTFADEHKQQLAESRQLNYRMPKNYWWKEPENQPDEGKLKYPAYEKKPPSVMVYPLNRLVNWYDIYKFRKLRVEERYPDEKTKIGKDVWPNSKSINVIHENSYAANREYWRAINVPTADNYYENGEDTPNQRYERHFFVNNNGDDETNEIGKLKNELKMAKNAIAELKAINANLQYEQDKIVNDYKDSQNERNYEENYEETEYFEKPQSAEYESLSEKEDDNQWENDIQYEEYIEEDEPNHSNEWTESEQEFENAKNPQICQLELRSPPAKKRKKSDRSIITYSAQASTISANASIISDISIWSQTSGGARDNATGNDSGDTLVECIQSQPVVESTTTCSSVPCAYSGSSASLIANTWAHIRKVNSRARELTSEKIANIYNYHYYRSSTTKEGEMDDENANNKEPRATNEFTDTEFERQIEEAEKRVQSIQQETSGIKQGILNMWKELEILESEKR